MGQFHGAVAVLQRRQMAVVRFHRFVDGIEYTLGRCHGILQFRHNAADLIERFGILIGKGKEACQLTDGDGADEGHISRCRQCAADADCRIDQGVDESGAGVGERTKERCPGTGALQFQIVFVEALLRPCLIVERFHNLLRTDHLLGESAQRTTCLRGFQVGGTGHLRQLRSHQQRERCQNHHQNGDGDVDGQHEHQRSQNGEDSRDKLGERL